MYAVTQPRHLDSQESVKAATISVLSILFCKSALPVLQNVFYYYLPLHKHTYHVEVTIRPHTRARHFCVSPPWYIFVFHPMHISEQA